MLYTSCAECNLTKYPRRYGIDEVAVDFNGKHKRSVFSKFSGDLCVENTLDSSKNLENRFNWIIQNFSFHSKPFSVKKLFGYRISLCQTYKEWEIVPFLINLIKLEDLGDDSTSNSGRRFFQSNIWKLEGYSYCLLAYIDHYYLIWWCTDCNNNLKVSWHQMIIYKNKYLKFLKVSLIEPDICR